MTKQDIKDWKIFIGYIAWDNLDNKIDTLSIEKLLNPYIQLNNYGTGLQEISCTILTYESPLHLPYLEYDINEEIIYIGLKLPSGFVEQATPQEIITTIKHTFLKGIQTMSTLKGLEQYNFKQLHEAIEAVFFPTEKGKFNPNEI